jgi:hypothetical protein
LAALKERGFDSSGVTIYLNVLLARAATGDAGGDDVSRVERALEERLTPQPKGIIVE